jgi:hypothetical protein
VPNNPDVDEGGDLTIGVAHEVLGLHHLQLADEDEGAHHRVVRDASRTAALQWLHHLSYAALVDAADMPQGMEGDADVAARPMLGGLVAVISTRRVYGAATRKSASSWRTKNNRCPPMWTTPLRTAISLK